MRGPRRWPPPSGSGHRLGLGRPIVREPPARRGLPPPPGFNSDPPVPPVRLPRFRRRHFYSGVLAIGIVDEAFAAWRAYRLEVASLMAMVVLGSLVVAFALLGIWLEPLMEEDELSARRVLGWPKRRKNLEKVAEFLPESTPPGWTRPFSPIGTIGWLAFVDRIAVFSWVVAYDVGYRLHVMLAPVDKRPVANDRAAEILSHFRGVGHFAEIAEPPIRISEEYPDGRTWIALSHDAIAAQPVPAKPPLVVDEPVNEYLAATRKFLPAKLPFEWSVPLALTEPYQGAWLIDDDDVCFIVCLLTSHDSAKLAVTIWHPDERTVEPARAHSVLGHFRGIRGFVPTGGAEDIPGAQVYLGEIETTEEGASLN
jgi:hypothetical protein